ncbi:MAG: hypothetical protein Kow001_18300 [Acidobacteriota bacterium]
MVKFLLMVVILVFAVSPGSVAAQCTMGCQDGQYSGFCCSGEYTLIYVTCSRCITAGCAGGCSQILYWYCGPCASGFSGVRYYQATLHNPGCCMS